MSEFEDQLKQEELARQQTETGETTQTEYTDEDGTVFQWDAHKKAWFPKIDEDFIAKYQMSYGVDQTSTAEGKQVDQTSNAEGKQVDQTSNADGEQKSQEAEINPETGKEYTKEEYEKYWRDYYNYYYYQQTDTNTQEEPQADSSNIGTPGESENEVKTSYTGQSTRKRGEEEEDRNSDYYHYFSQYYDENYVPNSANTPQAGGDSEEGDQGTSKPNQGKKKPAAKAGDKRKTETGWVEIDEDKNTNVYVSGLPLDVTDEEFKELMSKCGLIMPDLVTKEPKIKLYRDQNGEPKGDGRCCYIKVESVNLALQILDGSDLRGHTVHVERAKFTMKGNFDPKKKRKKLNAKEKKKLVLQQQKLLDWKPDVCDTQMRWEKVVVLKHMFEPTEFENDPMLINELREDVREECAKYGEVKNVKLYDRHPEGVMTVHFKEFESADLCVQGLNGRWFAKKRISAEIWDGKTKYEVEESTAEREERLKKWSDFLESDEKKTEPSSSTTPTCSTTSSSASVGASSSEKPAQAESSASGGSASASAGSAGDVVTEMDTERTCESDANSAAAAEAP